MFEPVIRAIPRELRGKLEPAEIFHQLLDHRWYLSQNEGRDVPLAEAVSSYVDTVLRHRRDEATVIDPPTGTFTLPSTWSTPTRLALEGLVGRRVLPLESHDRLVANDPLAV